MTTDKVIEAVRADLLRRSELGIKKYGNALSDDVVTPLRGKLQHAYEEALDLCNYLKWAIMEIDSAETVLHARSQDDGGEYPVVHGKLGEAAVSMPGVPKPASQEDRGSVTKGLEILQSSFAATEKKKDLIVGSFYWIKVRRRFRRDGDYPSTPERTEDPVWNEPAMEPARFTGIDGDATGIPTWDYIGLATAEGHHFADVIEIGSLC